MAAIMRITVVHDTTRSAADVAGAYVVEAAEARSAAQRLSKMFGVLAAGIPASTFTVELESGTTTTGATGTVTLTHANITANDTLTLGGRVLTWKVAAGNENEITIGANLAADTTALVNAINAHSELSAVISATGVTATGVVTITYLTPGLAGKHFTMATSDATAMALSAANLTLSSSPTVQSAARTHRIGT